MPEVVLSEASSWFGEGISISVPHWEFNFEHSHNMVADLPQNEWSKKKKKAKQKVYHFYNFTSEVT